MKVPLMEEYVFCRYNYLMRKILLIVAIVVAISTIGFLILNKYIYTEKQGGGVTVAPYEGILTGEHVCLPHKDTSGPQTLECAFGIKTDAGEYYSLDFDPEEMLDFNIGGRFRAKGLITPVDTNDDSYLNKYPIVGIFTVIGPIEPL